jgi:5-(aminomethyl)-3-furanmethanol phosphate kinase
MRGGTAPVVVKLGGSFAFSRHLPAWIEALVACAGHVVMVPGGGPFADAVRSAQPRMGFDDGAAHRMAVLAMEQYGHALVSLNGLLSPADSIDGIHRELTRGRVPVWMPGRMVLGAGDIAPSWDATSDSLAAWLAGRIGVGRLLLIKHIEYHAARARFEGLVAEDLAAMGIVDPAFTRHLRMTGAEAFILGPSEHAAALAAIRDGAAAGVRVS